MADHQYSRKVVRLGIPDAIIEHAEQKDQWNIAYYDSAAIMAECRKLVKGIKTDTMVS